METENSKGTAILDAFPFFSQYGHYLIFMIILSVTLNLLLSKWRKGEQFERPPTSGRETKEKELTPDEGDWNITMLSNNFKYFFSHTVTFILFFTFCTLYQFDKFVSNIYFWRIWGSRWARGFRFAALPSGRPATCQVWVQTAERSRPNRTIVRILHADRRAKNPAILQLRPGSPRGHPQHYPCCRYDY